MSGESTQGDDPPTVESVAQQAIKEWAYQTVEHSVTGDDVHTSIPCQLRFTVAPEQDTEAFHQALNDRGYKPLDHEPDQRATTERVYYEGEIAPSTHYNRVRVLVFRGDLIRLYPKDGYVPDSDELAAIIGALVEGFRADVRHDPIEQEANV
jgi:hypothetical protein